MTLTVRKVIVVVLIGTILLFGNIIAVANWLAEKGIADTADWIREEFLTGTAIAVIVSLLILLVNPARGWAVGFGGRCPVCNRRLIGHPNYCSECGSRV